jgi:hypothetical protein
MNIIIVQCIFVSSTLLSFLIQQILLYGIYCQASVPTQLDATIRNNDYPIMSGEHEKQRRDQKIMLQKIQNADGFFAALDQSGGSTSKALQSYGIPDTVSVLFCDDKFLFLLKTN